jgi:predicted transcriptional regulator
MASATTSENVPVPGGKLEYAVLSAVWEAEVLTAREVHERVGVPLDLVYTTTSRVLDRLCAKGLLSRERQGKAFSYRATTPRPEIERARMSRTLGGLFTGGARPAMAALVEAIESIDAGLLDDLAQAVEAARLRPRGEP